MWHVESMNDIQKQRPGKYAKEINGMKPHKQFETLKIKRKSFS